LKQRLFFLQIKTKVKLTYANAASHQKRIFDDDEDDGYAYG